MVSFHDTVILKIRPHGGKNLINYILSKDKSYYIVKAMGFSRPEGTVLILHTYNGLPVKEIADEAFISCSAITSLIIGENVTKIGARAFKNCINLREVAFSKSLKEIGESAFSGCSSLLKAILPEGLEVIAREAFSGCKNLIKLKIPSTLKEGGYMAFAGCRKAVGFSDIKGIDSNDFTECTSFYKTAIEISKNMSYNNIKRDKDGFIFYSSDDGCLLLGHINARSLKGEVVLPCDFEGKNYAICHDAFYGANEITSVKIPYGVLAIGDGAFYYCYRLKSINIPATVKKIGENAFFGCAELALVQMDNDKIWQVSKPLTEIVKDVEEKYLSTDERSAQTLTKKYVGYEWTSKIHDDNLMKKF